jgi:hypothetical protein
MLVSNRKVDHVPVFKPGNTEQDETTVGIASGLKRQGLQRGANTIRRGEIHCFDRAASVVILHQEVVLLNRFDVVGVIISPVAGSLSDKVDQVQHVGVAVIFAEDLYRSSSAVCTGWNTERNLIAVVMKRSTQQVFISNVKVIVLP